MSNSRKDESPKWAQGKININQKATVTLTERGAEIYTLYYDALHSVDSNCVFQPKKAGDTWRTELWQIMRVLGPFCANGAANVIESCELELGSL